MFARLAGALAALALIAGCSGGGGVQTGIRVEIEATPPSGAYPLSVSLKATVNGQPAPEDATYEWDLGDGTTSEEENPVHVFNDIGNYEVTLKMKSKGKKGSASAPIEVLEVGPGTDITVEGVEANPSSVNPGSPVSVKVTLRNRGTNASETPFINRIYINTVEADFDPTGAMANGVVNVPGILGDETVDKSTTITLADGFALDEYWIWVLCDAGDSVDEIGGAGGVGESNNLTRSTTKLTVTSASLPIDLTVSEPVLSGTNFTPGTPVTVNTTVDNIGTSDAGPFALKVFLSNDPTIDANDTVIHTATIGGLAGNASAPQVLSVDVPADIINRPWYLGVIADTGSEVAETDETNNAADYTTGLVTTTGSTGCTEDAAEPNDTQTQATVLVPGTMPGIQLCGDTADWFKIDLGAGDRLSSTIDFQNVNGNLDLAVFQMGSVNPIMSSATSSNSETVNSGTALSAGTYLVRVTLAGSTGGNVYDLSAAVEDNGGPGIDLMSTAITFGTGSGPFEQGVAHSASVTVYNFGMMGTTTSFGVALWLSTDTTLDGADTLLGTTTVMTLAAGASNSDSRSVTIPVGIPDGYYNLIAVADSGNSNVEDIETNNTFSKVIGVGDGCLDDPFEPNNTIVTATPMDNGTFTMLQICVGGEANGDIYAITTGAGGTIQVSIAIDGSQDLDMRLVEVGGASPSPCTSPNKCTSTSVSPAENVQYTSVNGGTYYVKVYGFSSATGGYSMTVSGSTGSIPDFSPNSLVAAPTAVDAGEDVQVDGRIKNNSSMATPDFEWQVRLSTDATIDGGDTTLATVAETALAANENRLISKKVTLPEGLPGGSYWLGVVADPAGMVTEGSESNNVGVVGPITVTALCNDDVYEENDSLAGAATIAIGGTLPSLVICSGDKDYFAITPATSGSLAIHADFSHAAGDIDMRLYQATTNLISSSSVNDDEDIVYAVTGGVTYKIYVYGFLGAANTYTLTTTLTP